ncbi:hypothetical protein [Rhodopirellula sallentina]|uniref:Uncharacterized protein n=1 Tax=Rhodopirellula sallentina SM41 TaxID=1263870 RepID=M5UGU2_9BACT|nr:hypothetical protein [Rhodopirellula sallentina]EMI55218.1 hypothetical protein RSSM_03355 [Rhodopirellula sallentina SM41]
METGNPAMSDAQKFLSWVNLAILLVLLPLVATNSCSKPETVVIGEAASSAVVGDDVADALANAEDLLGAGDFAGSFDMLLVASRLAPSDPKLFDMVVRFVDQASSFESEEAQALAEDLLGRGDSLVYFQRPQNVAAARKRLTDLQLKFLASESEFEPPQPLDSVSQFVSVAQNETNPTSVRTRAAEQARSLLDDLQLQLAMGEQSETAQLNQAILMEVYEKIDAVEQQCIESLFAEIKPRVNEWQTSAAQLNSKADSASNEEAPEIGRKLGRMADKGYDLLQELMPYSKSGIEAAVAMSATVEDAVKDLQRQKTWLYNKQSLARVREIESAEKPTPQEKIGYLAEIHEEQLSPYVLRRHNEVWEKIFEELPDEDEKVKAVRMRILRSKN